MKKPCSPDWVVPSLVVWIAASIADLVFADGAPVMSAFWWSIGLAAGSALLGAAILTAANLGLSLLPRPARLVAWIAAGLGLGAWIAEELWAFGKLGTKDHDLAVATLFFCGAAGLGLGLLAAAAQGGSPNTPGLLFRIRSGRRLAVAAVLSATAAAMAYIDRTRYVGLYEEVHIGLRFASLYLAVVAVSLVWQPAFQRTPKVRRWLAATSLAAALLTFFTLGESAILSLHRIDSRPYPSLALATLRNLTDVDRDGHSSLLGGRDCAPFDRTVHPGAIEIPGDGIDNNCSGNDLARRSDYDESIEHRPMPAEPSSRNVVLITIDCMRADRLRIAGYERPVTPSISALANQSLVFGRAYATGSWTSIAVSTMMRSTYARRLNWTSYVDTTRRRLVRLPFEGKLRKNERPTRTFLLPTNDPRKPLAWWLQKRGLHTMAVVNDGVSRMLSKPVGTGLGFDTFKEVGGAADMSRGDAATTDLALDAVEGAVALGREPFYLWVHFFGAHRSNFRLPEEWVRFKHIDKTGYDDRLSYSDAQVGRLLERLAGLKTALPTTTIVTADHGAETHGGRALHGNSVSEDVLRVPLLIRAPDLEHRVIETAVSTVDLMPTVLALTDTPIPPGLDGIDLLALARGAPTARRLGLLADNWSINQHGSVKRDQVAAFDGWHKLTLNRVTGTMSLESQRPRIPDGEDKRPSYLQSVRTLKSILDQYMDESELQDNEGSADEIDMSHLPVQP